MRKRIRTVIKKITMLPNGLVKPLLTLSDNLHYLKNELLKSVENTRDDNIVNVVMDFATLVEQYGTELSGSIQILENKPYNQMEKSYFTKPHWKEIMGLGKKKSPKPKKRYTSLLKQCELIEERIITEYQNLLQKKTLDSQNRSLLQIHLNGFRFNKARLQLFHDFYN